MKPGQLVDGRFRVEAEVAVGHSLGELSALHWAGAMDEQALLRLATGRGRAMTENSESGTMAGVRADPATVTALIGDLPVVIAGYNGPNQTVVAGPVEAIEEVGGDLNASTERDATSFTASIMASRSSSARSGGERRKKVRYSPTSFSLSDRLLIETPAVTLAPSDFARAIAAPCASPPRLGPFRPRGDSWRRIWKWRIRRLWRRLRWRRAAADFRGGGGTGDGGGASGNW